MTCSRDGNGLRGYVSGAGRGWHGRDIGQPYSESRGGLGRGRTLGWYIENGSSSPLAREPHDHLSRLHDFTRFGANRGHDAFSIGLELRKAHLVVRSFKLRLSGFDIRLRRSQIALRLIEIGAGR